MKLKAIVILSVLAVITVGAGVVQVNKATPQVTETVLTSEKANSSEAETTSASGAAALHKQAAVASQEHKQPAATTTTATQSAAATTPRKSTTKGKAIGATKAKSTPVAKDDPAPSHTHEWVPVYETVTYDEVSSSVREICKGCGADITSWSTAKWNAHSDAHLAVGEPAGFVEKEIKITTPKTIQKKVGYKCRCGTTK